MSESNLNLHFPQPFCMYACVHILNIVCGRRESQNNLHFEKVNLTLSKTFYYLNKKTRIFFHFEHLIMRKRPRSVQHF